MRPGWRAAARTLAVAACAAAAGGCAAPADARPEGEVPAELLAETDPVGASIRALGEMRALAEKAGAARTANDADALGAAETEIERRGRMIVGLLARDEFDAFPAERGALRARIMFVVRPPAPADRAESLDYCSGAFDRIARRRAAAPVQD